MDKSVEVFIPSILPRKRQLKISAIIAAIHEMNTGAKVDPLRITPSRPNFPPQLSPNRDNTVELPMHHYETYSQSLVTIRNTSSKSINDTIDSF